MVTSLQVPQNAKISWLTEQLLPSQGRPCSKEYISYIYGSYHLLYWNTIQYYPGRTNENHRTSELEQLVSCTDLNVGSLKYPTGKLTTTLLHSIRNNLGMYLALKFLYFSIHPISKFLIKLHIISQKSSSKISWYQLSFKFFHLYRQDKRQYKLTMTHSLIYLCKECVLE